jgi:cell wall-associated NlpC family hydrolase
MFLFLSGCVHPPETIKDIITLKQDNLFYLDRITSDNDLLTASYQSKLEREFNMLFFAPWHRAEPFFTLEDVCLPFKDYKENLGFGENKRKHSPKWLVELEELADLTNYPNTQLKGITVRNTNLRFLPTSKPHFNDFNLAGEGYPFDNLQNSSLWANTPVFISHISKDGSWVLGESPFALGWIPIDDIAFVDGEFIQRWETNEYIAVIKDKTPMYDKDGQFRFKAHIGAIFPKISEDKDNFEFLLGIPDENRKAVILRGMLPKISAVTKPLKATQRNVAQLADRFLGQTYGWGGMYENRDCSAMVRDLFVPFGIWLPRNSTEQTKAGRFIPLKELGPEDKEKKIIQNGVPYFTLIWLKGHIMLYIGTYQGRAVVMHNFWGIATRNFFKGRSRFIVGESVITTLQPGIELPNIDLPGGNLLNRIEGMVILIPT